MIGRTLSHYKIVDKLGEGGMGVVYRAHDTTLHRDVALKVLPASLANTPDRRMRFEREAAVIAALKHPNIVTVHSIEEAEGTPFMTMELVEGGTLSDAIPKDGLPEDRFVYVAETLADALANAHDKGIIHRDLKPANIMFDADGRPKVLDFGLAKLFESDSALETDDTICDQTVRDDATQEGQILGTLAYMSPEQAEGQKVDHRSDIFALGVVLYEMAAGERPFKGATNLSTISSILRDDPRPVSTIKKAFPRQLAQIINRCLEKNPDERYQSAASLRDDVRKYAQSRTATGPMALLRQPRVAVPITIVIVAAAAAIALWVQRGSKARWARQVALPEIARLIDESTWSQGLGYWGAFELVREAERTIPDDPTLQQLKGRILRPITIHSAPPGARVYVKPYAGVDFEWEYLGDTPIDTLPFVFGVMRLKLEKPGFETVHDIDWNAFFIAKETGYVLSPSASLPPGMSLVPDSVAVLHVAAAPAGIHLPGIEHLPGQRHGDFLMDRYEVSNQQYKRFVDAGGYKTEDYWQHPFEDEGMTLSWAQAMDRFVDRTGQPGPAMWEVGDYPDGKDDHPVAGVSWYEAAAYTAWAGKSLPTIYHWDRCALTWASGNIVPLSNFGSDGPVPVGSRHAENRFGTQDLAGNVREWCMNKSSRGGRFILGGGFSDPVYAFNDAFAQPTFDRSPTNGFRCMRYLDTDIDRTALEQEIVMPFRDFMKEPIVSDETFALFLKQYAYDKTDLHAEVEERLDDEDWVREKITFDAAYGGERMMAYLFLPKAGTPPYQTIIYFPGSGAIHTPSSEKLGLRNSTFYPKSGRAFMYPIYKSTYERGDDLKSDYAEETNFWKDHVIMWQKDFSRSIDYLETREDIDASKLAFYGVSWGADMAPLMIAPEPRIKVGIVVVAGLLFHRALPEVEPVQYLPRVTVPMLMLNGKYDFFFPYDTSQVPFFKLLGTPEDHKRMVINESGHSFPRTELAKEALAWLDRYLGSVPQN
ncbi:MAG: protein kinase [Candidatus Krumholzibacteria bacterium]|nr:protein kinase [Candidatus Krumholzibacteria bacterium]